MQYRFKKSTCTLMLVLAAGCSTLQAKTPAKSLKPIAAKPTAQTKLVVEPEAINALEQMSSYLRTLKTFTVSSQTSLDEELDSGQKVMVDGEVTMTVQRPDRLHIARKVVEDDIDQQFFYDGKTFTLYGNTNKFYASVPAPATIGELLDVARDRYDIELPLSDLFRWGMDSNDKKDILAASHIGTAQVNGVICEHYAFHNADVDWQLWIEKSATPLPRKMVITTTAEQKHPQFISVMNWDIAPKIDEKLFTFVPPTDAHKIEFVVIDESATKGK
jgi:hypothetical protein